MEAYRTSPESLELHKLLREMVDTGIEYVVMEVSSQALKVGRVDGMIFDYGIFTNMEPDHIGPNEHASFEEYAACKGMLFKQCKVGIANADDENFEMVMKDHTCTMETIGLLSCFILSLLYCKLKL